MVPKMKIRSSKAQIAYLCSYMNQHRDLAAGEFKTPLGAAHIHRQWAELQAALDELGPHRSIEQWKVCWRDQKRKARSEGGALSRARNATGNIEVVPELSLNSMLILDTIGQEMAYGCGPAESCIGSSVPLQHHPSPETPPLPPPLSPLPPSFSPLPLSSPPPPEPPVNTAPMQRPRRRHMSGPSDRFLNAQLQINALIEELVKEVHQSNEFRKENNALKRENNALLKESNRLLMEQCRSHR